MDQLMRLLTPQTWFGFVARFIAWLIFIAFANAGFAFFISGHEYHSLDYYLTHSIFVGGPFVVFFLVVTMFQMRLQKQFQRLSREDGLTGVNNRNTFFDLVERVRATRTIGILMMLDADHFKEINDTYGHQVGDACLQAIANTLRANIRQDDVLGRLGGEEFAIYLNNATLETAEAIGERLVQPIRFTSADQDDLSVTLSIGAVISRPDMTIGVLCARADAALYYAKRNGRALFVVWNAALQKQMARARSRA